MVTEAGLLSIYFSSHKSVESCDESRESVIYNLASMNRKVLEKIYLHEVTKFLAL